MADRKVMFLPLLGILTLLAVFTVRKHSFVSSDSLQVPFKQYCDFDLTWSETYVYSSLWNFRCQNGLFVKTSRVNILHVLLLLSGDIETCPGPAAVKCQACRKNIRKNQSNVVCSSCMLNFHTKCLGPDDGDTCGSCLPQDLSSEDPTVSTESLISLTRFAACKGFKILHQNVCGLLHKKDLLSELLCSSNNINILGLSETHENRSTDEAEMQIPGYLYERKLRSNGPGGGVGAYIRSGTPYHRRYDLEINEIECMWLEVMFPKAKSFFVGILYRPPDSSNYLCEDFNFHFDNILSAATAEDKECILTGDINCDFLVKNGHKEIKNILSMYGLKQMVTTATRVTRHSKTLIDIIATTDPDKLVNIQTIPSSISDHDMVGCSRKLNNLKYKPIKIKCRNYRNYCPDKLARDIEENANWTAVLEENNVSIAWQSMKQILLSFFNKHAPIIEKRIKGKPCPWLTANIKKEMNTRDYLLRKARQTNKEVDWSKYKHLKNRVNNLIKSTKARFNRHLINENISKPDRFWKLIKTVFPTKAQSSATSAFKLNEHILTNNVTIANAFCNFFTNVASKIKSQAILLKDFVWSYTQPIERESLPTFNFSIVQETDVLKELKLLKNNKAVGLDDLPPRLLKDTAKQISKPLAYIINLSLWSGLIPQEFKEAKVTPIFKCGDRSSFLSISVLSIPSKILEKCVQRQLINHLQDNNLLSNCQYGFRPRRSTELAITLFIDNIRKELDKGMLTGAVFVDLQKAFDTVSHGKLLSKLPQYGITGMELEWFTDYLFNRKHAVKYNSAISSYHHVICGVPQGSILGPLLFLLHFNDVTDCLQHSNIIMYADDAVVYTSDKNVNNIQQKLTQDMSNLSKWLDDNELVINLKQGKTEAMLFGTPNRLKKVEDFKVLYRGNTINRTLSYNYLGVTVDPSLHMTCHLDKVYKKASSRLKLLSRIRSSLNIYAAESVYRCMILPVLFYCCISFTCLTNTMNQRLSSLEKRAIKIIMRNSHCKSFNNDGKGKTNINIMTIEQFKKRHCCAMVYKALNNLLCEDFNNYFQLLNHNGPNTRNKGKLLRLPKITLESTKKSFFYSGALHFNNLPLYIRDSENYRSFIKNVNSFLL